MSEDKLRAEKEKLYDKIIPVHMNANFFFERAVRSLDRFHYDKALKYFGKAVEYEPDNPVNHCNMAGILSETGDYEGSNKVLSHILENVDPGMTECYYYMANNYANMERFEDAERSLVTYLEEDSEGQFLEEAEELMELFHYELNRPAKINRIKSRGGIMEHERARALLEEGKFSQAVELLKEIVQENPDFLAARNNLALAYYYVGLFNKAKETIGEVLELEPGNLHALCNLAIFYQHEGDQENLEILLRVLSGTVPFYQEHVFKLATTMGILGRHQIAYGHFKRLLKDEEMTGDPSLYHYAAVAAYNCGWDQIAQRNWELAARIDPESDIAGFYLSMLSRSKDGQGLHSPISYHYHIPFEEQLKQWEQNGHQMTEEMKNHPLVRSSFFWALRHGDDQSKLQVIQALGFIGDEEVMQVLQWFTRQVEETEELRAAARRVLEELGVEMDSDEQQVQELAIQSSPVENFWNESYQAVIDGVLGMKEAADSCQETEIQLLWLEFLKESYPEVPQVHQTEGWSAALEYWSRKLDGKAATYQDMAQRYGVSVSMVSRYARQMDNVCGLKAKLTEAVPKATNDHR